MSCFPGGPFGFSFLPTTDSLTHYKMPPFPLHIAQLFPGKCDSVTSPSVLPSRLSQSESCAEPATLLFSDKSHRIISQNHRMFGLEGTFNDHLVQLPSCPFERQKVPQYVSLMLSLLHQNAIKLI